MLVGIDPGSTSAMVKRVASYRRTSFWLRASTKACPSPVSSGSNGRSRKRSPTLRSSVSSNGTRNVRVSPGAT